MKAMISALVNHLVDQAVCLGLFRGHEVIALTVALDNIHGFPGILSQNTIEAFLGFQNVLCLNLNIGALPLAAAGGLEESRKAPMEAAMPTQMVETSGLIYCMVS